MPPRDRHVFKTYTRLRAVEEALFETLADAVGDEAVDAVAASMRIVERGEALYEHPDYEVFLDLAVYEHRVNGQTVVERHFEEKAPTTASDEHTVLTAMTRSRLTLLTLGAKDAGVGVQAEDLLFGGSLFLADPALSKERSRGEIVILARVLPFDGFAMTPCTPYLDFDPQVARMLAAGLPLESSVPMTERYTSVGARLALSTDLSRMALSSVDSVKEALAKRFAANPSSMPA